MTFIQNRYRKSGARLTTGQALLIHDMDREFIMLFCQQIVLRKIGDIIVTPRIAPFMRRKPGQKKRTVHVKGHYRHKA
jgi:hypothetical protein